jgi:hypothetical protein
MRILSCIIAAIIFSAVILPYAVLAEPTGSYVTIESDNATEFVITEQNEIPTVNTSEVYRIVQGACVSPNDTIDMAGVGWYSGYLEYFGRYYDGYGVGFTDEVQARYHVNARDLDHFWLDPKFFSNHLGWWYSGYTIENNTRISSSGYDRIFYVSNSCNATPKEVQPLLLRALNESEEMEAIRKNVTSLPVKTPGPYELVLTQGREVYLEAPYQSSRWIFGRVNGIYDSPTISNTTGFSLKQINGLEPGSYDISFVHPGKNGIIEEHCDTPECQDGKISAITSPFRSQADEQVHGYDPYTVRDLLDSMVSRSFDDSITKWRMLVEEPKIEVTKMDYVTLTNNHTMIAISGYTNDYADNNLTIKLDVQNGITLNNLHYATVIDNGGMRAYRAWNSSFIIDTQNMYPGQHYFTIVNDIGATAIVPMYVYRELEPNYRPKTMMQFIDNSPFIPTPTPRIVIQTKVVDKIVPYEVKVNVTPSQESVNAGIWNALVNAVLLAFAALVIGYVVFAYIRGKKGNGGASYGY